MIRGVFRVEVHGVTCVFFVRRSFVVCGAATDVSLEKLRAAQPRSLLCINSQTRRVNHHSGPYLYKSCIDFLL